MWASGVGNGAGGAFVVSGVGEADDDGDEPLPESVCSEISELLQALWLDAAADYGQSDT